MFEPKPKDEPIAGLSDYILRKSRRARNVLLKVSVQGDLEVVIPKNFDMRKLPEILQKRRAWIEEAIRHFREERGYFEPGPPQAFPERIFLRALGEEWGIEYREAPGLRLTALEKEGPTLTLRGKVGDVKACKVVLRRWITYKAVKHLIPWLRRISRENELPFVRTVVRGQKTRWGSCSRQKTISINQKLLFLPENLVRYIFVHELCHTIHLNHSPAFWASLKEKEPGYREAKAELRKAWRLVPTWLD
jgi:predicted metal-dependent hydrolase